MDGTENCLSLAAQELAEARLAAKRAARAEAREIRMKELERQQKEVEERPDKDFNDKGARTASSLSAATLASLGGTSSRRGSGDTSISVDTEASIREIKDSLAEVEEKYKKAMVSNAQLDNEKTNFMYQVDTLKDVLLELEEQLAETHRQYEEKSKEFEREKHSHRTLQIQYNELKESLQQRDELLTRHGIVLSSDLSPNGGSLDGPMHEALVESSSKVMDNAAPVSKTGDGPLGKASEVKMKSETAEEGQSVQSSKTADAGVQRAAKMQTEETSLLSEKEEEAERSTAVEQVAKVVPPYNEDSIIRPGMGLDASSVTNQVVNSSNDASDGHIEETDTLQTQRDVDIKGSIENQLGEVEFERATCSENESSSDVFQDAMEFDNEQNISAEKQLHNLDKNIAATNEEPEKKPLLESPVEGYNVQGILQNLGKHLDMAFDTGNDKLDGPVDSASDLREASGPIKIHQDLEESGVPARQLDSDRNSMMKTEGIVAWPKEAAGTKGGEDIASEQLLERSVVNTEVINSCGDGSMAAGGSIQDGVIPLGGKEIESDVVLPGKCTTLEDHEVKSHVAEVDLQGKTHSDDGEFYECFSEGSNPTSAALEPKVGEQLLNGTQHQEASNTGFNVSSPPTLEEMNTNLNEQLAEKVTDDPSQLGHMHNHDTQLCNANVDDKDKIEKQGIEGDGTIASQVHDNKEVGIDKTASLRDLGESDQSVETQKNGNSLEFNKDGKNVDPSTTEAQEFMKGSAAAEHINAPTLINDAEIPVQAVLKLQNKGVLTEGNNDFHEEGLMSEATEQETEMSSLPPSKETTSIELNHDLKSSTQGPGMENAFAKLSEALGLSESSGYSKEDTLDRNVKRTKGKNKEDCSLS